MKPSNLRTLATALALKQFGVAALDEPVVAKEVARFVSQRNVSNFCLRSVPPDFSVWDNKAIALIAAEMLLCAAL